MRISTCSDSQFSRQGALNERTFCDCHPTLSPDFGGEQLTQIRSHPFQNDTTCSPCPTLSNELRYEQMRSNADMQISRQSGPFDCGSALKMDTKLVFFKIRRKWVTNGSSDESKGVRATTRNWALNWRSTEKVKRRRWPGNCPMTTDDDWRRGP